MKPNWVQRIDHTIETLLTVPKLLLLSNLTLGRPKPLSGHQDIVILGNGPSLKEFIDQHLGFLQDKAVCCVNNFVRTQAFTQIKPNYYVIAATDFWQKEEKPGWQEERFKIFQELSEKTEWPLMLLVPVIAKKHNAWKQIVAENPKITISYFNNTPVEGFPTFLRFAMNQGLGMPRPHNVLVASLSLALMMRFKTIYITGADHSWMKEVFVTDENRVFLSQKHFYDDQLQSSTYTATARPMYAGSTKKERRLHEILQKWYYSFRSYWDLKSYAHSLDSRIVNLTPNSYIDAFERKQVSELIAND